MLASAGYAKLAAAIIAQANKDIKSEKVFYLNSTWTAAPTSQDKVTAELFLKSDWCVQLKELVELALILNIPRSGFHNGQDKGKENGRVDDVRCKPY